MLPADRFTGFVDEIQQIEKLGFLSQGRLLLDAFARHTGFQEGALYLRETRGSSFRLAARIGSWVAPENLDRETHPRDALDPSPALVLPLESQKDPLGWLALARCQRDDPAGENLAFARLAAAFVGAVIANQRFAQEMREGDFQLKYRLWELESLYDIGLSIAATLNIDELADEILFRMISLTNARRGALYLREDEGFRLYRSFGEVREGFLEGELADRLMLEGRPLTFTGDSTCLFPGCTAYVAVPIKGTNDAVIGVLAAADRETRDGGLGHFEANDLRLLALFGNQVAIALENSRLHREALEGQMMEREFELAATIQRDILPKATPQMEGIELAALSRPARQVGGDYHAFFVRDGVMTALVADVAGKSMPAALLVSALHAVVQLLFAEGRELGEIATELNRHIHRWSAENKFVTLIMVSIDPENETLQYVNAGHNPAYLVSADGLDTIRSNGLPIGILGQTRYAAQTRPFPAGSMAVLYSDGITEAENTAGEEFENERLEAILTAHINSSAAEVKAAIAAAVQQFVGDAPQKDDETLVVVRRI